MALAPGSSGVPDAQVRSRGDAPANTTAQPAPGQLANELLHRAAPISLQP